MTFAWKRKEMTSWKGCLWNDLGNMWCGLRCLALMQLEQSLDVWLQTGWSWGCWSGCERGGQETLCAGAGPGVPGDDQQVSFYHCPVPTMSVGICKVSGASTPALQRFDSLEQKWKRHLSSSFSDELLYSVIRWLVDINYVGRRYMPAFLI